MRVYPTSETTRITLYLYVISLKLFLAEYPKLFCFPNFSITRTYKPQIKTHHHNFY